MGLQAKHFYDFGPFQLDATKRLLLRNGRPLPLAPRVIETLLVLVENHGQLVEKDELMKAVWPDTFVEEANLAVNVSLLRKTLGGEDNGQHYIETIPKRGYRFVAPVRERREEAAGASATEADAAAALAESRHVPHWVRALLMGGVSLVVLAALLVALNVGGWRNRLRVKLSPPHIHSVAVLPLANLSGDPSQEYLADGLTEALVTDLAQIRALRVISRTSAMQYKGTSRPLPQIARELNVDAVVEGSVVRLGDRVRITAQLVEAGTDTHLWAQTYEGNLSDILSLQSQAAQAIVREVRATLTPEEKLRLATLHMVSPEAHEAYLKGRYFWNQRTPRTLEKSLELFQQAIRKDPSYAKAYAAVASDQYPPREMAAEALAAAVKALALDETLAEPHAALAILKAVHDYDWEGSDAEFRRAMELDPSYSVAHHWYAFMLASRGRNAEAYPEIVKAHELDPLNAIESTGVGFVLYWSRNYDACIEQVGKVLELDPNFFFGRMARGECFEQKKSYDKAITDYQEALRVSHNTAAIARLGHVFAVTGRKKEALALLNELGQIPKSKHSSPWQKALIYTGLGDQERAMASLEQASEQRSIGVLMLKSEPVFDLLRTHPRFLALLKRVRLEN